MLRDSAFSSHHRVNGEWAGINKKVKIRLLRRAVIASEWGNYTSIEVALRNRNEKDEADDPDADIYSLTVLIEQNSVLCFCQE